MVSLTIREAPNVKHFAEAAIAKVGHILERAEAEVGSAKSVRLGCISRFRSHRPGQCLMICLLLLYSSSWN